MGTAIGRQFTSEAMSVIFLTLAAGSILYVVIQLLGVAHKNGRKELLYWASCSGWPRVRHRHGRHCGRRVSDSNPNGRTFTHSRRRLFWLAETAA